MPLALTDDTRPFLSGGGAMGELIRAHDWSSTALGAAETWPEVLRSALRICLSSAFPTAIYWGPDFVLLYNDSWAPIPAERHPGCLGRPAREVWSDIWSIIGPQFATVMATGQGWSAFDQKLPMVRNGEPQETYWDYSFTPLIDGAGRIRGILNQGNERTAQILADRRQAFRLALEETLRGLDEPAAIAATAVRALGRHLGANRVGFGEMQPDDRTILFTSDYTDGLRPIEGAARLDDFGEAAVARQRGGETLRSADVLGETIYRPKSWEDTGTRAFVSVPLVRDGRLKAVLFVHQREVRRWSDDEVALIEAVAARVWDAIERGAAEAALRDSEATLRAVLDTLPVGILIAGAPSGRITGHNRRAEAILGHDMTPGGSGEQPARWVGFHEDGRPVAPSEWPLTKVMQGETQAELEVDFQCRDGRRAWVGFAGAPMTGADGRIVGGVLVVSDIAARKRSEHLLAAAKVAAEEANLAKSTFIANMSHELRTPLSAIIGYSEMMIEEVEDGAQAADLAADMRKIEGNARHLLGLINDVLDLSKVESGKMEVYAERFAVEPVVHDLATTVRGLLDKKRNRLVLEVAPDAGAMEQDLTKVRQILLNLLGNAAKFTEDGTITLAVSRRADPHGDAIVFRVGDTGIGMSAEQLARLFQRFQQADSSTTRRFGGTGLGLSLTKAFVDMLGGTVGVESIPGRGSSFTVRLPARYVPSDGSENEAAAAPDAAAGPAPDLVLVIDDDADQRALMTRFLRREGFRTRSASDGASGLALARELKPRAILLDVMMPGIDGWSVLTALKADPELAGIPVVMVTFMDQRGLAASLGATDYVLKPVQWDRFKAVMDRFRPPESRALVIDDDADTRARIRTLLEKDGWSVVEAGDGREGLDRLAGAQPGVILLDLTMPVMDGFAFMEELRARPDGAEIPVIVLTARDLTRDDRRRLAGASQILSKGDVSLRGVVERLEQLAGR